MREAVEQRSGKPFILGEDLRPFREGEIGRDDQAGSFVALAEEAEQMFGATAIQRDVTEFIDHYYHHERNHQGLENRLIDPLTEVGSADGAGACRERLGGVLRYYYRDAA